VRTGTTSELPWRLVAAAVVHGAGLAAIGTAAGDPLPRLARALAAAAVVALVLVALRTPVERWAGVALRWAALVVLTATEVLTITMGLGHLTAVGLSLRGAGAAAATLAGLVLLAALVGDLWRHARRWQRALVLPVALCLAATVGYPVAIATHATTQPPSDLGDRTPGDLGLAFEAVSFPTDDGVLLSAWYLPSANGAAVVLLHGASSTRSAVLEHAAVLNRNDYGVLLVDARGHGQSEGDPMDLGWLGEADVDGAVDHLLTRAEIDPDRIGVVGMSMGGEEAIGAAGADPRITAVVAEGATNRTYADRDAWLPRGAAGWVQRRMDQLAFALVDLVVPAAPPPSLRDAARAADPTPILLIAGDGEADAARSIQGATGNVEIWETGTGHTRGLAELAEEWERRVVGFLDLELR
jgi:pimeloyl-ACP methyl ester carboxylesterase